MRGNSRTREKNATRKDLRRAKKQTQDEEAVRELSIKFHKLLRLHSKSKKASLQTKVNLEAFKGRREYVRSFW